MIRIVRRLYKDGYYYVALNEDNKRVTWKKIKGNKNAKAQVVEKGKFRDKYKPVRIFTGKTKIGYESQIKPTPKKAMISQVSALFTIYDPNGKPLKKQYWGSDTFAPQTSKSEMLEAMKYSALGQALAELGLIADSKSARTAEGKASQYNAKMVPGTLKYIWYVDKK